MLDRGLARKIQSNNARALRLRILAVDWEPILPATEAMKAKAYRIYAAALRKGLLVRPDVCEECGQLPESKGLHGHHYLGYEEDHALDVEWLCQPCHSARHRPPPEPAPFRRPAPPVALPTPVQVRQSLNKLLAELRREERNTLTEIRKAEEREHAQP